MGFRRQKLLTGLAFCTLAIVVQPFRLLGQSSEPAPPTIRSVSPDQIVNAGSSAYFSVDAVSYVPPQYQWQFNGEDIPGATNETLILRNVDETNEGAYRVRVANSVGEVFSAESILRVVMPPIDILAQPADGAASLGQSISLVVWLTNLPEPSFQWFLGGVPISGATNYEFRILRATTNDGGIYSVLVSNKYGAQVSDSVTVSVGPPRHHAGAVDPTFDSGQQETEFPSGDYHEINRLDLFPDGRVAATGYFRTFSNSVRTVGIIQTNGVLLRNFGAQWVNTSFENNFLQVRRDGRIFVSTAKDLLMLQDSGAIDFHVTNSFAEMYSPGEQPSGRFIVFYSDSFGATLNRLNSDGTVDWFFGPTRYWGGDGGAIVTILGAGMQPDGKFLVENLGRYLSHGAGDASFSGQVYASGQVFRFQPNGKILVGGRFKTASGPVRYGLLRLNSNGTPDEAFNPPLGFGSIVNDLAIQPDGRIVVIGSLNISGRTRGIIRLESDGTMDGSFAPGDAANGPLQAVVIQPDGKVLVAGTFGLFNNYLRPGLVRLYGDSEGPPRILDEPGDQTVEAGRDTRLIVNVVCNPLGKFEWRLNGAVLPEANNRVLPLTNVQNWMAGEYQLVISNAFGSVTSAVATLNVKPAPHSPGSLDPSFFPGTGADNIVTDIAVQPDAKIIIGGSFTEVEGVPRAQVARLHPDGSLDASFEGPSFTYDTSVSGLQPARIRVLCLTSEGKVLVTGNFTNVNGLTRKGIARLNADGTLDLSFVPEAAARAIADSINACIIQPDGSFYLGGSFERLPSNLPSATLARFKPDGRYDYSLYIPEEVLSLSSYPDGRVVAASTAGVTRWLDNGMYDNGFGGLSQRVNQVLVRPDGKVLVVGDNLTPFVLPRTPPTTNWDLALLSSSGSLDPNFKLPMLASSTRIVGVAMHGCDRILVYGSIRLTNNPSLAYHIIRLLSDGTLDSTFAPRRFDAVPRCAVTQGDGQILIGGEFSTVDGARRDGIARLNGFADDFIAASPAILGMPESQSVTSGEKVTLTIDVPRCLQLNYQWQRNGTELAGATNDTLVLENIRASYIGEYRALIWFGDRSNVTQSATLVSVVPEARHVGSTDIDFYPPEISGGVVLTVSKDNTGNLLLGGSFTNVHGHAAPYFARLDATGQYDASFYKGSGPNGPVRGVAVQDDGKIILAGSFTSVNGFARPGVSRLNADGTLTYQPRPAGIFNCLITQPDGKVLFGGRSNANNGIWRVTSDIQFESFFSISGEVFSIALQRSGDAVVGGAFINFSGRPRNRIARLLYNRGMDPNFNAQLAAYGSVQAVAVDRDDYIYIGGDFVLSTMVRSRISRLNPDGSLDTNFNAGDGPNGAVYALLPQPNGKILIGGAFTSVNGIPCGHIARLNWDGSLDSTFVAEPGADDTVFALAADVSGKVYIGGAFSHVNGYERDRVARLNNDPLLFQPQFNVISGFQVSLFTFAGQRYVLEFKSSMEEPDWRTVTAVLGDGTVRTLSDSAPEDSQRFYRVRVE